MIVDLVQCQTRDGVRLDGILQHPAKATAQLGVDGVILVHGTGGSFYSSSLFDTLRDQFLELGAAVLRVNTRGHDGISTAVTGQGGKRQGAAYELVDDCRHDLLAWHTVLNRRGCSRIGWIGHSLGAVKCIYTLAQDPTIAVVACVAISPPCLSYARFCSGPHRDEFLATYAAADAHVQAGRPATLMEVKLPLAYVVSAAGYLDKYGPDEQYNFMQFIDRVACPTLVTFGSVEVESNMAFAGIPESLAEMKRKRPSVSVEVVPGADHFYTGKRQDAARVIEAWFGESVPR